MDRLRTWLDLLVALAMLGAAGTVIYVNWPQFVSESPARVPTELIEVDDGTLDGRRDADLILITFSDFQCPYCAKFATETWPSLVDKYVRTGRVLSVFRHLPLKQIHPNAWSAAVSAECARRQGRFADFHDLLFRQPRELEEASLPGYAASLGLAVPEFSECQSSADADAVVARDLAIASRLGISSTPAFLIGRWASADKRTVRATHLLKGARPLALYDEAFAEAAAVQEATSLAPSMWWLAVAVPSVGFVLLMIVRHRKRSLRATSSDAGGTE